MVLLKLAYEDLCDVVLASLPAPGKNKKGKNSKINKRKSFPKNNKNYGKATVKT